MTSPESKLTAHGFQFRNWPGPGEQAAAQFGLSHAVIVPANSRTVIIGGQVGVRDDGTVPPDLAEEVAEAFDHVERALKAAGLGDDAWEHVYSIITYEVEKDGQGITDIVVPIARKYLKTTRPAWTGITVKGLVFPSLHLEIAVQADREFMRDSAYRDWGNCLFHLKSERPMGRDLLNYLKASVIQPQDVVLFHEDRFIPELLGGSWDYPSASKTKRERYVSAILGRLILVAPMILIVLVPTTAVSLATLSVCSMIFAIATAYSSPTKLPLELLAATAAYAAVLVVFVGGATEFTMK